MSPGETLDGRDRGVAAVVDGGAKHREAARRLARAFDAHLDRENLADCSRVVVHETRSSRYEYVDGVHYVTGVDDAVRDRIEAFVDARDLEVVMDGHVGFAFRHSRPRGPADAHVAGAVVALAFDATFTDLDDVVEVVDGATEISWTELDARPA
ncbi:hypothetical protein [Halorubellus sp. PRR65]|uniref:hypothetical protein n=1 Tax=Halorubellus sp. PRR65 TaxID=3098148 RepID=UPI002B25D27C|nr:hypothetical protein [Halorubellus sp. PRR65]